MSGALSSNTNFIKVTMIMAVIMKSIEAAFLEGLSLARLPLHISSKVQYLKMDDGRVFGTPSRIYLVINLPMRKIVDRTNGDVAINQYHLYERDIEMMTEVGMDAYRFSISWSRLIPEGRGPVNEHGVKYYNDLINGLLKHGIEPYVTLNHFDLPQVLEDEYGGWLNSQIVRYCFADYAETCFELFGDRVKYWMTINEPNLEALLGYDLGVHAPGRCSLPFGNCSAGNSTTEPYITAHYQILSHAAATGRNGSIGVAVNANWFEPLINSTQDLDAVSRILDLTIGWFLDPIFYGEYPASMRTRVGSRLPEFTTDEVEMVKGSVDFVGLNHYTTMYVADAPVTSNLKDYWEDMSISLTGERDGVPIGQLVGDQFLCSLSNIIFQINFTIVMNGRKHGHYTLVTAYQTDVFSFYIVPTGIKDLVDYIKFKYYNPPVFITENGMAYKNNDSIPLEEALNDTTRVKFHREYLSSLSQAVKEGADVRGYFVWSLADNFELSLGYTFRFGILFVDFRDPHLKRYKKLSAMWFEQFLSEIKREEDKEYLREVGSLAPIARTFTIIKKSQAVESLPCAIFNVR
eukprot:Gb_31508 [translate_table: standard]